MVARPLPRLQRGVLGSWRARPRESRAGGLGRAAQITQLARQKAVTVATGQVLCGPLPVGRSQRPRDQDARNLSEVSTHVTDKPLDGLDTSEVADKQCR
jgi:hypothetical protein